MVKSYKVYYNEIKKSGRCPKHPKRKVKHGQTYCSICLNFWKKRYNYLKSIKKCIRHPKQNTIRGTTRCKTCIKNTKMLKKKRFLLNKCFFHPTENILENRVGCKKCVKYSKIYRKKYMKTPQGKLLKYINNHLRKYKLKNIVHNFTSEQWEKKKAKSHGICLKKFGGCGKRKKLTLDHTPPLSKIKDGHIYNLKDVVPICRSCNSSKGDRRW